MSEFESPPPGANFRRVAVLLAVAVALAGVAWVIGARTPRPAPAPAAAPPAKPEDDAIDRALGAARVDSTKKNEWVDLVPGIDEAGLTPAGRELFIRFANAERCTCGCGFTLAACRRFDTTCEVSLPRIEALLDSVRRGLVTAGPGLRRRPTGV